MRNTNLIYPRVLSNFIWPPLRNAMDNFRIKIKTQLSPFLATKYLDILNMWWNILEFNLFLWCPVCPSRGNHNTQRKEILMSNDSYKPINYNGYCKNFMGCCPKMAAKRHHFCKVGLVYSYAFSLPQIDSCFSKIQV